MLLAALPAAAYGVSLSQTPRLVAASGVTARYADFTRKPGRIIYSGDGAALVAGTSAVKGPIKWTVWNKVGGRGQGADWHNNCNPDCVGGNYHAYPASVHVYRARRVAGYLLFTRMTLTYTGAHPPYPGYKRGSVTFDLTYQTKYKTFVWSGG